MFKYLLNFRSRKRSATLLLVSIIPSLLLAREIPTTNMEQVLNAGRVQRTSAKLNIQSGLYVLGPVDKDKSQISGTHYLLLDRYNNSEDQFIGVMISADSFVAANPKSAFIFRSSFVRNNTSLMLYPITIDIYGNLSVESETTRTSPYIEISLQNLNESQRYPYIVQGKNGLLDGQLLGMRKAEIQSPRWNQWPSSGIYQTGNRNSKLVVNGDTLAIHENGTEPINYIISPINGDDSGKIAALSELNFDTMSESDIGDTQFKKIAFFLNDFEKNNVFLIATPKIFPGRYDLKIYAPQSLTFMDRFFPGLL